MCPTTCWARSATGCSTRCVPLQRRTRGNWGGAAETYRANPAFDTAETIAAVGTGEAVTSMLDPKGVPGVAERTLIRPPSSQLGPITAEERAAVMAGSPVAGRYDEVLDRESASEMLAARAAAVAAAAETAAGGRA